MYNKKFTWPLTIFFTVSICFSALLATIVASSDAPPQKDKPAHPKTEKEKMDLKPPLPGSFVWYEGSIIVKPEHGEPDPPDLSDLVSIVIQHHEDGSFDTMGCSYTAQRHYMSIGKMDAKGMLIESIQFPMKEEIKKETAKAGMSFLTYPQLPDTPVTAEDSWKREYVSKGHYALKGIMKFAGNLDIDGRSCHIIEFSWNGTINGKEMFNKQEDLKLTAKGKYAIDAQTRMGLTLECECHFAGLGIMKMQTKPIRFGHLPAQTLVFLQRAYQLLSEDKLDEAESVMKQVASELPDFSWLNSLSRGIKMPVRK